MVVASLRGQQSNFSGQPRLRRPQTPGRNLLLTADRWARLLASASDRGNRTEILAVFSSIPKELTAHQVRLLDRIFDHVKIRIHESDYELRPTPMIELGSVDALIAFDEDLRKVPFPEYAEDF
jgi:hypothetical protein